ncbi:hypothetical protein, partial [Rhizobium leguminosarum]|uniref:hypothetical protein n=1 Tax=Rhizobium leguminosarum TaxID=384 RepID=UPI003F9A6981
DGEEILDTFYTKSLYKRDGEVWRIPFMPETLKGAKAITEMVDAENRDLVEAVRQDDGKRLLVDFVAGFEVDLTRRVVD